MEGVCVWACVIAYIPLAKLAGASYLDKLGITECMHVSH